MQPYTGWDNKRGDICTVENGIIVQQVNAQGFMGSGVARAIRDKFPMVWDAYKDLVPQNSSDRGFSKMGLLIPVKVKPGLYVANIVGQQFAGNDGQKYTSYDALDAGLKALGKFTDKISQEQNVDFPLHFPLIGCGLGGGNWTVVSSLIESNLPNRKLTLWTL